jgi:hypothetical protein
VVAIVPAPLLPADDSPQEPLDALPVLTGWVRGSLVGIALGLLLVFGIAAWLRPYQDDGTPRTMETHLQLGLFPCHFKTLTGLPCPSCGMTTSFALLIHGDPWNSLRANWVGTLLALIGLLAMPWCLLSCYLGRPLFLVSIETVLVRIVVALLALMIIRWVIVLGWMWWNSR